MSIHNFQFAFNRKRDTAGQERFRTITRSHFRNAKGIIFTFDISNRDSFDMLEYWFRSLEIDDVNFENNHTYLLCY